MKLMFEGQEEKWKVTNESALSKGSEKKSSNADARLQKISNFLCACEQSFVVRNRTQLGSQLFRPRLLDKRRSHTFEKKSNRMTSFRSCL